MPTHLRAKVIELAHSTPVTGHIGAEQTKHKIMKNYFWPGMAKEIKQICQSCERSQKVAKHPSKVAPMQKTPTFIEPNHKISLDIVGPLPITKRKNRFVLTYLDLATRYPDARLLQTIKPTDIANTLLQIITYGSMPLEILTDNSSNFVSVFTTSHHLKVHRQACRQV